MRHYVAYHNPEKMGYWADERSECKRDSAQPLTDERSECKRDSAQPSTDERSECKRDSAQPSTEEVTDLCIVTNKAAENLIGDRIWLIQGEGKPRKYVLRGTFIVASVGPDTDDGFRFLVRGRDGDLFKPQIPIGTLPWFGRFKMSQGNFAFGLQRISDPAIVEELERVTGLDSR
jgi:hypothetical protein